MRTGERRAIASAVTELEKLSQIAPALLRSVPAAPRSRARRRLHRTSGRRKIHARECRHRPRARPRQKGRRHRRRSLEPHFRRRHPGRPHPHDRRARRRRRLRALAREPRLSRRSSPAAVRVIDALDAAGFDLILLETVGTGQSEMDVAEVADVRVVITHRASATTSRR